MKKYHVFSRFFTQAVNEEPKSLSELAQYMAVFYFNMRTVHFRSTGENFLEIHKYAEELYKQSEEYYDDLIETALSLNETITAMYVTPGDWIPEGAEYNRASWDSISLLKRSVERIYDYLENVKKDYPSFVYSKIDSMLEYFDKQNYKISQMDKEI